jgi:hypothetical protein
MDYRYKQLEQELSALSKVFSELGTRLSEVAKEVTTPGVMPSEKLLEQISASRTSFENCRTAVHGHAGSMLVSPLPKLGELVSITAIDSLLKASAVAEENKFSIELEREKALQILGRVLSITHRETTDFKPLLECHAKLGELRSAISSVLWPHKHPDSEAIVAAKHPSNALLSFVENLDSLDDEKWMALETTITETYGKPLFVAASRGKLTVGPELKSGAQPGLSKPSATPAPPKAPVVAPPEPPKPAVAAEKPVEKKIVAEKAPEKPAPTPAPHAPVAAPSAPVVAAPAATVEKKVAVPPAPAAPAPVAPVPAVAAEKKEVVADKVPQKPSAPPAQAAAAPTPVTVVSPAPVAPSERKESSEKPQPVVAPAASAPSAPVVTPPAAPIPAPVPVAAVSVAPQAPAAVVSAPPVVAVTPSPAPVAATPAPTPAPATHATPAPVAATPAAPSRPPAPVPVAATPAAPVAATPVSVPVPAAPPVAHNNAHPAPAAQPQNVTVNSLSALATATEPAVDKKPAPAPVETIDRQRKEPRLAAPAPQPVAAKPEPSAEEFMAEEAQKTAAGDSSQRPQRWGFWRGNR